MENNDLIEIKQTWGPLAGSDTNGPHTKTANTIMELVGKIEDLRGKLDEEERMHEATLAERDMYKAEVERLKPLAAEKEFYNSLSKPDAPTGSGSRGAK